MSWSPDLFIGEMRPWPDSVHVVRGNTDETRRYTPERKDGQEALERRIDELCAEVEAEKQRNAKLFEAAVKWMAKAAHSEAENKHLREQVDYMTPIALYAASERERDRMRELGIEVG